MGIDDRKEQLKREYVPDEATALRIATAIVQGQVNSEAFSRFSQDYTVHVDIRDDVWVVYWSRRENGRGVVLGGGGPCVYIARKDGQIQKYHYMR